MSWTPGLYSWSPAKNVCQVRTTHSLVNYTMWCHRPNKDLCTFHLWLKIKLNFVFISQIWKFIWQYLWTSITFSSFILFCLSNGVTLFLSILKDIPNWKNYLNSRFPCKLETILWEVTRAIQVACLQSDLHLSPGSHRKQAVNAL